MLAFLPLYDPLPALFPGMDDYWLMLVVPLVVAISIVYKCTRIPTLNLLTKESAKMSAQILVVMVFAGLVLAGGYWAYVRVGVPFLQ